MVSRSRMEHALVARVRREHLHGLRMLLRCCSVPLCLGSLLCERGSREDLASEEAEAGVCGHEVRRSWLVDRRGSRPVLRSAADFTGCCAPEGVLAARGESFAEAAMSLLLSDDGLGLAQVLSASSSSSAEPDGRLRIEPAARGSAGHERHTQQAEGRERRQGQASQRAWARPRRAESGWGGGEGGSTQAGPVCGGRRYSWGEDGRDEGSSFLRLRLLTSPSVPGPSFARTLESGDLPDNRARQLLLDVCVVVLMTGWG